MTGIIVTVAALKVKNRSNGINFRTGKEKSNLTGKVRRFVQTWKTEKGSDYVIFNCPHCGHRNNQCVLKADYAIEGKLGYKCKMCRGSVEVTRPISSLESKIIISPNDTRQRHGQQPEHHPVPIVRA